MAEMIEVECKYCGSFMDVSKAIKINLETGEYEYICTNCAIQFKKNSEIPLSEKPEPDKKLDDQ